jgi:peroxiredoxin
VLSMSVMRWHYVLFLVATTAFAQGNVIHLSSKPAPNFTLKNLDNVEVASSNFAGKTRLVCFWASWDKPSQQQLSVFRDIERQYGASNLVVLAVALNWQDPAALKAFAVTNSITFPILLADYTVIKDFGGVNAIPTSILVEPHGLEVTRFVGLTEKAAITNLLEAIRNSQR